MITCETLQDRVLEDGVEAAAATPELREHVAQCPECKRFLNDLQKLTGAMHALPVVDAPDALVKQTARRVSQSETAQPEPQRKRWRSSFLPYAASGMVVFVVATITMQAYPPFTARLQDFELTAREDVRFPATYHDDSLLADAGISRGTLESLAETERLNRMLFGADTLSDRDATALGTKQRMKKGLLAGSEQKLDELTASGLAGAGSFMDERRNYQPRQLKENDGRLDDNGARFRLGNQPPAPAPQSEAEPETSRKSEIAASPSAAESVAPAEPLAQPKTMPVDDAKHANEENLPAVTQGPARQPVARDLSVTGKVGDSIPASVAHAHGFVEQRAGVSRCSSG